MCLECNKKSDFMTSVLPVTVSNESEQVWQAMRAEALSASEQQPLMASFFHSNILNHHSFVSAISFYLSNHLSTDAIPSMIIRDIFEEALGTDPSIQQKMIADLLAHYQRDPACDQHITPFLYFKGYHAIQSHRIAHYLWQQKRTLLATYIQSRIAELFDVDIHPAASIAGGLMVDHATGVVIGETSIIKENVSMLHAVTLGGSGSKGGKRHPTIEPCVLLSVGAKILGDITVGEGAKVGAGSVVLTSMPAHSTVVGVPARAIGKASCDMPALEMDHQLDGE